MSSTATTSHTSTYSTADIQAVMRKVTTDLVMMAQSTGAITEEKARQYGHDIELLAAEGYLRKVDVTLLSGVAEIRAVTYEPSTEADGFSSSRPGGVMWPKVSNAHLRVILFYNSTYTEAAREKLKDKMKISWGPASDDTSHGALISKSGRDYASNSYGVKRKDFGE